MNTTFTAFLEQQKVLEGKGELSKLCNNLLEALKEAINELRSPEFVHGEQIYEDNRKKFTELKDDIEKIRNDKIYELINGSFGELRDFFEKTEENFGMIAQRALKKHNSHLNSLFDKETRNLFGLSLEDAYDMYKLALQLTSEFEELRLYKPIGDDELYPLMPQPIVPSVTCAADWERPVSICVKGHYPKINLNELVSKTHLIAFLATLHQVEKISTTSTLKLLEKIIENDNLKETIEKFEITSAELSVLITGLTKEVDTIVREVASFKRYVDMRKKEVNNIVDVLKINAEEYFTQSMFAKKYMKSE